MSSKQQKEFEKKQFEVAKHNTGVYNEFFDSKLKIDELDVPPEKFDQAKYSERNSDLYWTIRQLSREKISVYMIKRLLEIIFVTCDAEGVDEDNQFEIVKEKFKYLSDLAQSCKLST